MRTFAYLTALAFLISCSSQKNKYVLESKSKLNFSEAYYQEWTSGIKGGGSGTSIYLIKKESSDEISIEGIYFNGKYSKLKYQGNNKYQGFIRNTKNIESWDDLEINLLEKEPTVKEEKSTDKKIPFTLNKGEAVISYTKNKKQKYLKIIIEKKEMLEYPM